MEDKGQIMSEADEFFRRAGELLGRLESLYGDRNTRLGFDDPEALCWSYEADANRLMAVRHPSATLPDDLLCIDRQKDLLSRNTRQFVHGLPANNALLWGPRGTGKSSLVRALVNAWQAQGLRLIELQRDDMSALAAICDCLYDTPHRYIIFCDDLSFEENDPSYKAIKVMLDGSVRRTPENVLIYATSNRRHLVPEHRADNLEAEFIGEDLHMGDTVEEKLSLSERFGLWVAFHPFNQEQYLTIVRHWITQLGPALDPEEPAMRQAALAWALSHGSRSGRSAMLFCRDWVGRKALEAL